MTMMKNRKRRLLILAIVFVVFNVLVFVVPFNRNNVFWIAYAFGAATILGQVAADIVAFGKADSLRKVFMGVPIVKIAYRCLFTQLTICSTLMSLSRWFNIPWWVAVVPCMLVLAFAAVAIIKADWARERIEKTDVKGLTETHFMHQFRADIESLIPRITDSALKTKVAKLAEEVRYSDPVSSAGLEGLEANMKDKLFLLKQAVSNTSDDGNTLVDELLHLVNERSSQCRVLRRQQ
jgi:hypothetical protein